MAMAVLLLAPLELQRVRTLACSRSYVRAGRSSSRMSFLIVPKKIQEKESPPPYSPRAWFALYM
jgi:hypothetical protein